MNKLEPVRVRSMGVVAAALLTVAGGLLWSAGVWADEPKPTIPGRDAYDAALADAEAAYVKHVLAAREQQISTIRQLMKRGRMTAEMHRKLTAEIKRLESLGRPSVDPEPTAMKANTKQVSLGMDTPSPLWSLKFEKAKRVGDELWVLWRLSQNDGMGAMVITHREASAKVAVGDLPSDAAVRHFVVGKTFNWADPNAKATYVDDEQSIGKPWAEAEALDTAK